MKVAQGKAGDYNYSCVMALIPEELTEALQEIGEVLIGDEDLYEVEGDSTFGRTHTFHVTALYGIREDDCSARVQKVMEGFKKLSVTFNGVTAFTTNPGFDVIIFDVEAPDLKRLNAALAEEFPDYKNSHGTYVPHCTLAYVKKGLAGDILERFKEGDWNPGTIETYEV
jgi:2'-5' RNA ligase